MRLVALNGTPIASKPSPTGPIRARSSAGMPPAPMNLALLTQPKIDNEMTPGIAPGVGDDRKPIDMAGSERAEQTSTAAAAAAGAAAATAPGAAGTTTADRSSGQRDQTGSSAAEHASGSMATSIEGATITCLTNAHYHSSREAFLDTMHRWFMFLVIALGAAALTDALPHLLLAVSGVHVESAAIKEACAAGAAVIAALDLTFDLSNRARTHSMMKRRYYELLADLKEGQKTPDAVKACLDRFSADEEPVYRVLYLSCWNAAQMTVFGRKAQRFEISFLGNLFKNWARRPSATYPVTKLSV